MGRSPLTHPLWLHEILYPFPGLSQLKGNAEEGKRVQKLIRAWGHVIRKQKLSFRQGKVKQIVPHNYSKDLYAGMHRNGITLYKLKEENEELKASVGHKDQDKEFLLDEIIKLIRLSPS